MLERMCAIETEYEDAKVEVARLESRVKDDYDSDVPLGLYVFSGFGVSEQFLNGTSAHNRPFQCHYMVLRLKTKYT